MSDSLLYKLQKRLPKAPKSEITGIANVLEKYDITPTIDSLDGKGYLFKDLKGRTARVREGSWRGTVLYVADPQADIVIVMTEGIMAGWIESEKLENLEDRLAVKLGNLTPLPEEFSFDQKCAHLQVHGGFYDGDNWICYGCERELVFNDKRRV